MAATHLDMGLRCIKYLLCAVNALFVLTGIMVIFVGIKTYAIFSDFYALRLPIFSPATLLIVVGILTFVIAFFGCCGAIRESTCMVLVFAVSLSIVLVLEVIAAITAYALEDGVTDYLAHKMDNAIDLYETNEYSRESIDFLQSRFHCCGVDGPEDWNRYKPAFPPYPESCYDKYSQRYDTYDQTFFKPYGMGCINMLSILVHRCALNLGTAAIAIALIQFTGIMFACTLGRAIRRQKTLREKRRWELRENLVKGYQPLGKNDPATTFPIIYMQPDYPVKIPDGQ